MDRSVPDRSDPTRPADPGAVLDLQADTEQLLPGSAGVDFPVSVVLPAGGTGERTGLQTPKQFCSILGRPLISYTAQAFERVSWIQRVVVVVAEEHLPLMADVAQRYGHTKVRLVPGGSTRHRSIRRGVQALCGTEAPKVVLVHDAVRPFVDQDFLYKITMAAHERGAAGAVRPLVSTVIATTSEGYLDHSLERCKYRASEMPQGFTYEVICQAYEKCTEHDLDHGTECLHLALQYSGTNAKLIEGPPTLWKVTYRRDLAAAESILKESLSRSSCVLSGDCPTALSLSAALQRAFTTRHHMDVDVVSDLEGDNAARLQEEWNFVQICVSGSLSEIRVLLGLVRASGRALLNPIVVVWVHLSGTDEGTLTELTSLRDLASAAKPENLLLYGVRLQFCKDRQSWDDSVLRLAEITSALIRDRNPALVGQLLRV